MWVYFLPLTTPKLKLLKKQTDFELKSPKEKNQYHPLSQRIIQNNSTVFFEVIPHKIN